MTIEPDQIADIPYQHREVIARWLIQRVKPASSLLARSLFSEEASALARDVMLGAAVDLIDPLSEDSTIEHATGILASLR